MPTISPKYASPNLRVAVWKDDHPGASFTWRVCKGEEVGVPAGFGHDKDLVVVTLHYNDGIRPDVTGWVDVEATDRTPDGLNTLITKALGRALKKSGYPDDMDEMKALMFWRERRAEIAAIAPGATLPALTAAATAALDAAGTLDPGGRPDQDGGYMDPAELPVETKAPKKEASKPAKEAPKETVDDAAMLADFVKLPEAIKAGLREVPEEYWHNVHDAIRKDHQFKDPLTKPEHDFIVQVISAWHGPKIPLMDEPTAEPDHQEIDTAPLWERINKMPPNRQELLWKYAADEGLRFNSDESWVELERFHDLEHAIRLVEDSF